MRERQLCFLMSADNALVPNTEKHRHLNALHIMLDEALRDTTHLLYPGPECVCEACVCVTSMYCFSVGFSGALKKLFFQL